MMRRSEAIDTDAPAGTVAVSFKVSAPPLSVYAALTDPALTSNWLGDLSAALRPGCRARLDFGDGDYFIIDDITVAPDSIAYRWRFLGIMPADTIRWHIEMTHFGSLITVTDSNPLRQAEWVDALREGWKDFTRRLAEFLLTGQSTRYDWRRTFDGGIELPCTQTEAMSIVTDMALSTRWLPIDPGLVVGAHIEPGDGLEPAVLRVEELRQESDSVRFTVTSPQWRVPTECTIALRPRGANVMLTVAHTGWQDIDPRDEMQRIQRRRFADMWIAALTRARDLCHFPGRLPARPIHGDGQSRRSVRRTMVLE